MFLNSYDFYKYQEIENFSLFQDKFSLDFPTLESNFNFNQKESKKIMQTTQLIYQFFGLRPKLKTVIKFGRPHSLNVGFHCKLSTILSAIKVLYRIRKSSKKKLVTFRFNRDAIYICMKDFVTFYPFKIKLYDFHDWRHEFVLKSVLVSSKYSEFEIHFIRNFYISFFI